MTTMRRLCLISHGEPAANPRLVRDADALAEAGYEVRVIATELMPHLKEHDRILADRAKWYYEPVVFSPRRNGNPSWNYIRGRRRLAAALTGAWRSEGLVARAYGYANPELATLANKQPADLFIAYQHNSLPAASWAAAKQGAKFSLDAQDLLSDCSAEPEELARSIETRYLSRCAYVSTMSPSAARRLQETNKLSETPIVLHNTPRLSERNGVTPPSERESASPLRIYWFGQTTGSHSLAHQVLDAMARLQAPARLVLRGKPLESFVTELRRHARELGLSDRLEILPRAEPTEMVRLAAEHDIMLGTQPGNELFNQLAIGNKVFTGMMAGLALALSDTIAHRELLAEAPGCGFLFRDGDVAELTLQLELLLKNRASLQQIKTNSWRLAENKFNWEEEAKLLLQTVERIDYDTPVRMAVTA